MILGGLFFEEIFKTPSKNRGVYENAKKISGKNSALPLLRYCIGVPSSFTPARLVAVCEDEVTELPEVEGDCVKVLVIMETMA